MSNRNYTQEQLFDLFKKIYKDKVGDNKVKLESDLENDLGIESLDKVEFIMEIEKELNILIKEEDINGVNIYSGTKTVKEFIEFIQKSIA